MHQQRAAYRQALDQLTTGHGAEFRRARAELAGYALAPYLDYYDLQVRLASVSDAEMAEFQQRHADLPVADILHHRWLKRLGRQGQWQRLLANYRPSADAELACYRLRALVASGEQAQAMAAVAPLWVVGESQPKACDPLFERWIQGGHLTQALAWERLQLAVGAGETRLARYLLRFFEPPLEAWARALYEVHVHPEKVARPGAYGSDGPHARTVIGHGLRRLAARDADAAARAWQRFQDSHRFSERDVRALSEHIVLALARDGRFPVERPPAFSPGFAEGMAEAALLAENWQELVFWVNELPAQRRDELRWQYWEARALAQTSLGPERARQTYQALAEQRNYYGFLAAERLGRPGRLNDATPPRDPAVSAELRRLPAMNRALELYAVGDLVNARREWFALLPTLDARQQYHAGRLAQEAGWITQGIFTAHAAELRDTLALRFPVAFQDLFQQVSHDTTVPKPFLLAIARQESAFDARARSRANALGLMQLLQPTASLVARRVGLAPPSPTDLYDPALNVALGGHHLARLLERYGRRSALAAAAYNAGEGRVDRWIRERGGRSLDVWIEAIPFPETRNYVKNVLAFTQVYGHLLGHPLPMLETGNVAVN